MQRKKLIILTLGLILILGFAVSSLRFWIQTKNIFSFGRKGISVDPLQSTPSFEEYQALSEKLRELPVRVSEYTILPENVLYAGVTVDGADAGTFEVLGGSYAKDAHSVYFKGHIVSKADHDSFRVQVTDDSGVPLDFIAEDKNAIFVEDKPLSVSKKELFLEFYSFPSIYFLGGEKYNTQWSVFNDEFYYYAIDTYGGGFNRVSLLKGVKPGKVRIFLDNKSQETSYITDETDVYYTDKKLIGADPATFRVGSYYAEDKYSVYRFGEKLPKADPETFVEKENEYLYSHDANHIYYGAKIIDGADMKTFKFDHSYDYSWDKNHVYYHEKRIPAADPGSFSVVGSVCFSNRFIFGKDKDTVFRNGERIEELDPKTFEIVDDMYARDVNTILWCGAEKVSEMKPRETSSAVPVLPITLPDRKKDLGNNYYKDQEGVIYYRDMKMDDVDTETFVSYGSLYDWALDKNFVYWKGKVVGNK